MQLPIYRVCALPGALQFDLPNEGPQLNGTENNTVNSTTETALSKLSKVDEVQNGLERRDEWLQVGGQPSHFFADGAGGFLEKTSKDGVLSSLAMLQQPS